MEQLDARRLLCPMPVIRLQNKVKSMRPGDQLEVLCTDPGALQDIPAWCRINGHQVLDSHHNDGCISIMVQVGAA